MISIRTSTLEAFRLAVTTDWKKEIEVVDCISRGQEDGGEESHAANVGTCWHRALEGQEPYLVAKAGVCPWHCYGGCWFRLPDIERARRHVGPGLHEISGHAVLDVGGVPVCLTGKCDWIGGLVIKDGKTKLDGVDTSWYDASLQWRCYLKIFQANRFEYNCYSFKEDKEGDFFTLLDIVDASYYPYPDIENDVKFWIARLLEFAESRGLTEHLKREREASCPSA